jgi:hypothetical protein
VDGLEICNGYNMSVYKNCGTAITAAGDAVLHVGAAAATWDAVAVVSAFMVCALGHGAIDCLGGVRRG